MNHLELYYQGTSLRSQRRDDRSAAKHLNAAKKIADFLQKKLSGACVAITKASGASPEVKSIKLAVTGNHHLSVQHRGYEIAACCPDAAALSAEFRNWLATDMTHITKIEPRAH